MIPAPRRHNSTVPFLLSRPLSRLVGRGPRGDAESTCGCSANRYGTDLLFCYGEVTERPNVQHWKCCVPCKRDPGFESLPLRQHTTPAVRRAFLCAGGKAGMKDPSEGFERLAQRGTGCPSAVPGSNGGRQPAVPIPASPPAHYARRPAGFPLCWRKGGDEGPVRRVRAPRAARHGLPKRSAGQQRRAPARSANPCLSATFLLRSIAACGSGGYAV